MVNIRKYGKPPFKAAVLHGGPGAPGEMALVAKELSKSFGVIEPFQSANSIRGQVEELKGILQKNAELPLTLVGWSWGAWLAFIFAAENPKIVKKLILVSAGPFEAKYAKGIMETRLSRLDEKDKNKIVIAIKNSIIDEKIGKIISKADSYSPIPHKSSIIKFQPAVYTKVWNEVSMLRSSGKLLKLGKKIKCPVLAIHGDYDSHPAKGVNIPLGKVLRNFKFILLRKCGHEPWIERHARAKFYDILKKEL